MQKKLEGNRKSNHTFRFHGDNLYGSFSDKCVSWTGVGQFQEENVLKNISTILITEARGYSWQILATMMAQDAPPGNPKAL